MSRVGRMPWCREAGSPGGVARVRPCQNRPERRSALDSRHRKSAINLKVPIVIVDELAEEVIRSTGSLDLASGEIFDVSYDVDRAGPLAMPAADDQYEFTSGTLTSDGKDVEFRIDVDVMRGTYFVNPTELLELKVRAAKLFAGLDGKALAMANPGRAGSAAPGPPDPTPGDPARRLH